MKIYKYNMELECPQQECCQALIRGMTYMQAAALCRYQQQPKNWPDHSNIPTYCIYMGSSVDLEMDTVDFYHYEDADPVHYSAAIVCGNTGGDYKSGWVELALRAAEYREQLRREFVCGFLTLDDLASVGLAALGIHREREENSIRPARKIFKL